jgi:hypothetical protein
VEILHPLGRVGEPHEEAYHSYRLNNCIIFVMKEIGRDGDGEGVYPRGGDLGEEIFLGCVW